MAELSKEDLEAKKSIERSNKISMIYREKQELDKLTAELNSARAKYDTPEKSAAYKKEINKKIQKQKDKLKLSSNAILKSSDKALVSEYKKTLGSNKDIAKAVNYNTNTRVMSKTDKIDLLKKKYSENKKDIEIYELLNEDPDKNSKEYADYLRKKKETNNQSLVIVKSIEDGKASEIKGRLDEAVKNRDLELIKSIKGESDLFNKERADFSNRSGKYDAYRNRVTENEDGTKSGGDFEARNDWDYDFLNKKAGEYLAKDDEVKNQEQNNLPEQPPYNPMEDPNGGGVSRTETETIPGVEDRGGKSESDGQPPIGGTSKEEEDYDLALKKANQEMDDLRNIEQDQFVHDYAPDREGSGNGLDNLIDAGRGIVGMIGANEEIPEYSRGSMFNEAMGDAQRMKNDGLSEDETNVRKRMAERGYAYDVKNIRRLAGGSAGVALGNLGRATGQLQGEYEKIAATDEAVRRGNQGAFRTMALQDEQINRQIFQDDLRQTEMTKQAGAGLVQDAINNIRERGDFEKQYGKGSLYYERAKTLDRKENMIMRDLEKGNRSRVYDQKAEIQSRIDKASKGIADRETIETTGTNKDKEVRKSLFKDADVSPEKQGTATYQDGKLHKGSSTFKSTTTDLVEEPKRKSLLKPKVSSKKQRADDILRKMEAMDPDNPEFNKLSAELDGIKL
jgi:hypothetical protein